MRVPLLKNGKNLKLGDHVIAESAETDHDNENVQQTDYALLEIIQCDACSLEREKIRLLNLYQLMD